MKNMYHFNVFKRDGTAGGNDESTIIARHENLVKSIAMQYLWCGIDMQDDLMQEGRLALVQAFRNFDPSRGVKFSTYAYPWIKRNIVREIARTCYAIKFPEKEMQLLTQAKQAGEDIKLREGREAGPGEIAEALGISLKKAEEILLNLEMMKYEISFNQSVSCEEEQSPFSEFYIDPNAPKIDEGLRNRETRQIIDSAMKDALSEKEYTAMKLYYGLEGSDVCTLSQVAQALGCSSPSTAGNHLKKGLEKLRSGKWAPLLQECLHAA